MRTYVFLFSVFILPFIGFTSSGKSPDLLFDKFVNPPASSSPFVRWWWNGNCINASEIKRELEVLHKAGIGGVEINPIAMPAEVPAAGLKPVTWLSKEWNDLVKLASTEARNRGMITDLIVGSGWPFGGEFLKESETIQRIIIHKISCKGGDKLVEDKESLYKKALAALNRRIEEPTQRYEVAFIRLVPEKISGVDQVVDLTGTYIQTGKLNYTVPDGSYQLVYGMLQRGNRKVMHGAPGAAGYVMNHYRREVTLAYLNRLKKISEDTGTPLNQLIRALFCDSIELDGANWSDGMEEIFFRTYGYRIEPWFPFVFYDPNQGYANENYPSSFADQVRRIRYDFNKLLVEVFLDNFTRTFQEFCTENGVLCRYQAYGVPFLMGMMEGNMVTDIPESNNWIYSTDMDSTEWYWNQIHGYMIWNLYAASGGHLAGRKVISCEAMTNTRGVFKGTLEEIKLHDDMNFITGINHTILHGFNYSPPEAGFPGWVRYGEYFSENNTWWPYFPLWAKYNARLSYVFQNSQPVKNIAILGPEGDLWSTKGLTRVPFHTEPWYNFRLWEPLSQSGQSCDYINERIIREATKENGLLKSGPATYKALILCGIHSMEAATASAIRDFVAKGGKLVVIGSIPDRSFAVKEALANDKLVKNTFAEIIEKYGDRLIRVNEPDKSGDLLTWMGDILKKLNLHGDVTIKNPDKNVFQIRKRTGNRDVYFFTNTNRIKTISLNVSFPTGSNTPWVWNPEKGTRSVYPYSGKPSEMVLNLEPLQSLLFVFEPAMDGKPDESLVLKPGKKLLGIKGPWQAKFERIEGRITERDFDQLEHFGTSDDEPLNTFAGKVTYSSTFYSDGSGNYLELGKINKGVAEVYLNGKSAGLVWYGKPRFRISGLLKKGENKLEIRYTSVLSNYVSSLKDNSIAKKWTAGYEKIPLGPEGEVAVFE